jgi:hypothetical protein
MGVRAEHGSLPWRGWTAGTGMRSGGKQQFLVDNNKYWYWTTLSFIIYIVYTICFVFPVCSVCVYFRIYDNVYFCSHSYFVFLLYVSYPLVTKEL